MTKWSDYTAILLTEKRKPNPGFLTPSPLLYVYNYKASQFVLSTKILMWKNRWSNSGKWSRSECYPFAAPHWGLITNYTQVFSPQTFHYWLVTNQTNLSSSVYSNTYQTSRSLEKVSLVRNWSICQWLGEKIHERISWFVDTTAHWNDLL